MSNSAKTLLTGLVCIAVLMRKNTHSICIPHHLATGINMDCSHGQVHSVPDELPVETRSLDLSYNNICHFNRAHFKHYALLQELHMDHLSCRIPRQKLEVWDTITLENDTFADLISLRVLRIDNSPICGFGSMRFQWPKQLHYLNMDHVPNVAFDFRELRYLEHLSAKNCNKHVFPSLHPYAPLRILDLQSNSIAFVEVEQVAIYCTLDVLLINEWASTYFEKTDSTFASEHTNLRCMCIRLKKWTEQNDISGLTYLQCPTTMNFNGVPQTNTTPCNMSFDTANMIYKTCLDRIWLKNLKLWLIIFSVIVSLIIVIVPAAYITVRAWTIYKGRRSLIISADPYGSDNYSSLYEFESEHEFGNTGERKKSDRKKSDRKKSDRKKSDRKKSDRKKSDRKKSVRKKSDRKKSVQPPKR